MLKDLTENYVTLMLKLLTVLVGIALAIGIYQTYTVKTSDVFTVEAEVTDKIDEIHLVPNGVAAITTHSYYLMYHIANDEDASNQYKVQVTSTGYNDINIKDTVFVSVYSKGGKVTSVKLAE